MAEIVTPPSATVVAPVFCSTIHIMKVDAPEPKVYDGKSFTVYSCQVGILQDDGALHEVGRLVMNEALYAQAKVGIFRAAFGLQRAAWGKTKGDIISVLTGLVPAPVRTVKPA